MRGGTFCSKCPVLQWWDPKSGACGRLLVKGRLGWAFCSRRLYSVWRSVPRQLGSFRHAQCCELWLSRRIPLRLREIQSRCLLSGTGSLDAAFCRVWCRDLTGIVCLWETTGTGWRGKSCSRGVPRLDSVAGVEVVDKQQQTCRSHNSAEDHSTVARLRQVQRPAAGPLYSKGV